AFPSFNQRAGEGNSFCRDSGSEAGSCTASVPHVSQKREKPALSAVERVGLLQIHPGPATAKAPRLENMRHGAPRCFLIADVGHPPCPLSLDARAGQEDTSP